jgi:hypothetical protein
MHIDNERPTRAGSMQLVTLKITANNGVVVYIVYCDQIDITKRRVVAWYSQRCITARV